MQQTQPPIQNASQQYNTQSPGSISGGGSGISQIDGSVNLNESVIE